MARLLRAMLESLGYSMIQASTAEEALAHIEQHAPTLDLLMVELSLPGVTGHKVAAFSAARRTDLPVVILCDDVVPNEQAIPACFLKKPFTAAELTVAIETTRASIPAGTVQPAA